MSFDLQIYGSKLLRKKSAEVKVFDQKIIDLAEDLRKAMYDFDGVGLAAIQVGIPLRIICIDVPNTDKEESLILVNPEIVCKSDESQTDSEGCLSIPDIKANVVRPMTITVKAQTPSGEAIFMENITGFFARIILHEIDHINGVLFTDKIDPVKKNMLAGKLKKLAKEQR